MMINNRRTPPERCSRCRGPAQPGAFRTRYAGLPLCSLCEPVSEPMAYADPYPVRDTRGQRVPASREVLDHEITRALQRRSPGYQRPGGETRRTAGDAWLMALHEAAHCVSALETNGTVLDATIEPSRGCGHTRYVVDVSGETWLSAVDQGAVALAGRAAELRWFGRVRGCRSDDAKVAELQADLDFSYDEALDRAKEIVERRATDIEAIAEQLLQHRTLSGAELRDILTTRIETLAVEMRSGRPQVWPNRDRPVPDDWQRRSEYGGCADFDEACRWRYLGLAPGETRMETIETLWAPRPGEDRSGDFAAVVDDLDEDEDEYRGVDDEVVLVHRTGRVTDDGWYEAYVESRSGGIVYDLHRAWYCDEPMPTDRDERFARLIRAATLNGQIPPMTDERLDGLLRGIEEARRYGSRDELRERLYNDPDLIGVVR